MKKFLLLFFSICLIGGTISAQDAKKAFGKAKQALSQFNLDNSQKDKLQEAVDNIDIAIKGDELSNDTKTLLKRGDIYNEIATQVATIKQVGIGSIDDLPKVEDPAGEAFECYKKVLNLAEKKWETKDALKGIGLVQGNLNNFGIYAYEAQKYDMAHSLFLKVLEAHTILDKNGAASILTTDDEFNEQLYIAGLAALNAKNLEGAKTSFEKLYKKGYEKATVFEALYKIYAEKDIEKAFSYLEKGREKFPDDVSLLFTEINHYLKLNQLETLIGKIKLAISKEPENVSLYSTMGNIYDNLYQKENEAHNHEKADEYFNGALDYYNQALGKDDKYLDAIYSIGALYYNKAAFMTKELNTLQDDYSKKGLEKYKAKKVEVFEQFDKALPYFQKAESMNANDVNTLIALKEIFARKDQLDVSNEFKARLDKVQAGENNESSYFNE